MKDFAQIAFMGDLYSKEKNVSLKKFEEVSEKVEYADLRVCNLECPVEGERKFDRWMKSNYAFCGGLELQYRDIYPRIIAEEYLENENNDLYDYKFWCFNGKVEFIMFLSERAQGLKMNNYDRDWKLLPFTYDFPNSTREIPKPEKLDEMIEIAEKLATGFPHVRVDLYQLNDGTIKFGEMTFTSDCGVCRWSNDTIDYELGKMFEIS